jgi:hypothetical protein
MNDQRAVGNGNGETQKDRIGIGRSADPLLDFPSIPLEDQPRRERELLRRLMHEQYHGIDVFFAKPATKRA